MANNEDQPLPAAPIDAQVDAKAAIQAAERAKDALQKDALQKALDDVQAAVAAKRGAREAISQQIEALKVQARALSDDIVGLEDALPQPKPTGKVTRLKT